ncbi:hypothetical protein RIR_jg11658.t1 [Rhizophagus irregularis DAOM 181602=DAOM 197198]|nr:hypothetical protein RIR_jg11658.t1 [Rhizophagus irregularis DAOM 181602=DAOM 197198]
MTNEEREERLARDRERKRKARRDQRGARAKETPNQIAVRLSQKKSIMRQKYAFQLLMRSFCANFAIQ